MTAPAARMMLRVLPRRDVQKTTEFQRIVDSSSALPGFAHETLRVLVRDLRHHALGQLELAEMIHQPGLEAVAPEQQLVGVVDEILPAELGGCASAREPRRGRQVGVQVRVRLEHGWILPPGTTVRLGYISRGTGRRARCATTSPARDR